MKTTVLTALVILAIAIPIMSQGPNGTKPSFEVASIKPNTSGDMRIAILNQPGGRFIATGASLRVLMTFAYRVREFQISGGPSWTASDRWDIEARAEAGSIMPPTGPPDPTVPDP